MVRHLALFGETAYNSVLINGMVLGGDGRKMSKSLGNFVNTPEVFGKHGADAARQWAAAGGSTGTDIPFRWEDVEYGRRFQTKLWNACRFSAMRLEDYDPISKVEPMLLDRWILSKLERTVKSATDAMENCEWMNATEAARNFTWHIFCDDYLEAAKYRLYGEGTPKLAAQQTLYYTIKRTLQLLAPVIPHITEEIYNTMYAEGPTDSIHISRWPEQDASLIDEEAERAGDIVTAIIGEVRKQKNKLGVPLNKPVKRLALHSEDEEILGDACLGEKDIRETLKIEEITYAPSTGEKEVEGHADLSLTLTL
jgi:valyl-tRNA synthetase